MRVVEAQDGLELGPGVVVLARGGSDLEVEREGVRLRARIVHRPLRLYHPSVDALFESSARACGASVLAAILTGMGDDGLAGARAIRAAGGRVLAESSSSCVVAPIEQMAAEMVRLLRTE